MYTGGTSLRPFLNSCSHSTTWLLPARFCISASAIPLLGSSAKPTSVRDAALLQIFGHTDNNIDARNNGLRQFQVYQGRWSAADRDFERDIIPMCRDEGMGLAPWGALGGGNFKTEEQRKSGEGRKMRPASEKDIAVSKALEEVAKEKGTILTSVVCVRFIDKVQNQTTWVTDLHRLWRMSWQRHHTYSPSLAVARWTT